MASKFTKEMMNVAQNSKTKHCSGTQEASDDTIARTMMRGCGLSDAQIDKKLAEIKADEQAKKAASK